MVVRTVGFENKTLKNAKERIDYVPVFNTRDTSESGASIVRKVGLPFESYSTQAASENNAYDENITYPAGTMVVYSKEMYVSLVDDNKGNTPGLESEFWKHLSGYAGYPDGGVAIAGAANTGIGLGVGSGAVAGQVGSAAIGEMSRTGRGYNVYDITVGESIVYTIEGAHKAFLRTDYRLSIRVSDGPSVTMYYADPEHIESIELVGPDTVITFAAGAPVPTEMVSDIKVMRNKAQSLTDILGGQAVDMGSIAAGIACEARGGASMAAGMDCRANHDFSQALGLAAFSIADNSLSHSGGYEKNHPAASHMVKLYAVTSTPAGADLKLLDWSTVFGEVVYKDYLHLDVSDDRSVAAKITMNIMAANADNGLLLSEKHVFTFMLDKAAGGVVSPLVHISGFDEDYLQSTYSEVVNIGYDVDNDQLKIGVKHDLTLGAEAYWMADLDIKYMAMPSGRQP